EDFFLPRSSEGARVSWSVVSGDAISVSGSLARVTQPGQDAGEAGVALQATFTSGDEEIATAQHPVKVLPSDQGLSELHAEDVAAIEVLNADDIRTKFCVAARGPNGSQMDWRATGDAIALVEDPDDLITVSVERPATGAEAAEASL